MSRQLLPSSGVACPNAGTLHLRNSAKLAQDYTALPTERQELHRHYRDKFGLA